MKQSVNLDPYVAEIVKRNTGMAYFLGRAESLLNIIYEHGYLKDARPWISEEIELLIEDISNYYEGL